MKLFLRNIYLTSITLLLLNCQNNKNEKQEVKHKLTNKSGSLVIDGTRLNYFVKGKGVPLLIVGSDPDLFSKDLEDYFQLNFIETRLNAKQYSPIDTSKYTFDSLLKDIDTLRATLGIEKFAIGGHSVMGAIAYKYAQKYPQYVSHIILIATPSSFGTEEYKIATRQYWELASSERKDIYNTNQQKLRKDRPNNIIPRESLIKSLVASGPKRWHNPNFDATVIFERLHYNLDFMNHLFGNIFSSYNLNEEGKIGIPAFIALGKSDYIAPPSLWKNKYHKNRTIEIFEKSGHSPHYEESEAFNKRLLDWMKKLK